MKSIHPSKSFFLLLVATAFFGFPSFARAADRYWVGGTGNWSDAANHWSDVSGGTPDAGFLPTLGDNAFFNSASNANGYTVTVDAAAYCQDLSFVNPASGVVTFAGSAALSINGNASFASGMTNNYTGAITFSAGTGKYVGGQDGGPTKVVFSSDGTKMYISGDNTNKIFQYTLGTAWDTATAVYVSKSFTVTTQDATPIGLAFSSDGLNMYVLGAANKNVYQYTLSVAWDISTASYASKLASVGGQDTAPKSVVFSSDGTGMYVSGDTNNSIYQYTLGTPWDVSTAAYVKSVSVSAKSSYPYGVFFAPDGAKMYVTDEFSNVVYQYALSVAWDVSTAVYAVTSIDLSAQDSLSYGTALSSDGTRMYLMGRSNGTVFQYNLGVAWDVSSASLNTLLTPKTLARNGVSIGSSVTFNGLDGWWQLQDSFATTGSVTLTSGTLDTNSQSISSSTFATAAGTKKLLLGTSTWTVTGNGATVWSWSTTDADMLGRQGAIAASYSGSSGTRTITMGSDASNPSLSVAGGSDTVTISAASLNNLNFTGFSGTLSSSTGALSVYGGLTLSSGMTNNDTAAITMKATSIADVSSFTGFLYKAVFNPDGTKLYVIAYDTVLEFSLSTAWDLSTASYAYKYKNASSESLYFRGLSFSPDGTIMYLSGTTTVYQYALSTAWDVSTASYTSKSKYVYTQDNNPWGLAFSPDGTKMYVSGSAYNKVYQYDLSTPWDVSTAIYESKSAAVGTQDDAPGGIAFNSDGTKMYIVGSVNDTVFQYALGAAWDVSTAAYVSKSIYVGTQDTFPYGVVFSPDGTKMFVAGGGNNIVYRYSLSTPWDVSAASLSVISPQKTIATNGKSLGGNLTFNGVGGAWQLSDALTLGVTKVLTLTNGSFDDGGKDVSTGLFSSSNSNPRTLTKGAGTWSLTGTGTVWDAGTSTNLTLADTGTTKLTNNSTSAKTFAGGGMTTYSTLWNATGGTGTVTITGSNAFNIFRSDAGRTNLFTAGTTQTAKAFLLNGSLGNLITLGSTSTSPFFLMNTGPWVMASYISVSYSTVTPASGVWYAGPGSTDGGNNSGWNFTSYPNINTVQGDVQFLGDIRSN